MLANSSHLIIANDSYKINERNNDFYFSNKRKADII